MHYKNRLKLNTTLNYRQFKAFYRKFCPLAIFFFRGYFESELTFFTASKNILL